MQVNSTNFLLTALAVSDMLTMLSYIPFAVQFYCLHGSRPTPARNSLAWMRFLLFHCHFSVTTHTTSIWLGVLLAVFRYSTVRRPGADCGGGGAGGGAAASKLRTARWAVAAVYVLSVVVLVPTYMMLSIVRVDVHRIVDAEVASAAAANSTAAVNFSSVSRSAVEFVVDEDGYVGAIYDFIDVDVDIDVGGNSFLFGHFVTRLNFWIHALVIKLVPCFLMSVFGLLIVCAVRTTHSRGLRLRVNSTRAAGLRQSRRNHHRTTTMLVVVIVLFLVTELPQGVLSLVCGIRTEYFHAVYTPLGDVMDIVALVNNAVNFTLYCAMSHRFRRRFFELFCRCFGRGGGGAGSGGDLVGGRTAAVVAAAAATARQSLVTIGDNGGLTRPSEREAITLK